MPVKKEMTEEERAAMLERMATMRQKAIEKKKQMGEVTKAQKEVKEKLYEKKKQEVEEMKKLLNPTPPQSSNDGNTQGVIPPEHAPEVINQVATPPKPSLTENYQTKQIDEAALRKQIKEEMKQKYKSKYKASAYPYFPHYYYPPHPSFPPQVQQPPPQPQPQPEKQVMKQLIQDKVDETYKSMINSLFPNI